MFCNDDQKNLIVEGYASVFNITDRDGDVVSESAFYNLTNQPLPFFLQHASEAPIGSIIHARMDDYGLFVRGRVDSNLPLGSAVIEWFESGVVLGFSVGFWNVRSELVGQNRYIRKAKLEEISLVNYPSNNMATISKFWFEGVNLFGCS